MTLRRPPDLRLQRRTGAGFALVSAVFLLVVLGLLAAVIASLSTSQQIGSVRELYGTQAYFAARAGIEWGLYRVLQSSSCLSTSTLPALSGSAANITVRVNCSAYAGFDEAGTSVTVYQITSTATRGNFGNVDYAERQLQAQVSVP